jgi:uncharacterized protein YgbK (DUF1537 family)
LKGLLEGGAGFAELPKLAGKEVVLAGSCSEATRAQIKHMAGKYPSFQIDPVALSQGSQDSNQILGWVQKKMSDGPVLIYSSMGPDRVAQNQARLGTEQAGRIIEQCMAGIARELVGMGVDKLIVAGGETSGAVMQALGITALKIGPEIDPGVPWTVTASGKAICLALKSGNFGSEDFFTKALNMVP